MHGHGHGHAQADAEECGEQRARDGEVDKLVVHPVQPCDAAEGDASSLDLCRTPTGRHAFARGAAHEVTSTLEPTIRPPIRHVYTSAVPPVLVRACLRAADCEEEGNPEGEMAVQLVFQA